MAARLELAKSEDLSKGPGPNAGDLLEYRVINTRSSFYRVRSVMRHRHCADCAGQLGPREGEEYHCEPCNYRTGKYFLNFKSYQLHCRICRF